MTKYELAKFLEYTLIDPKASYRDYDAFIANAKAYGFYGVVVPPYWVDYVKYRLEGSGIRLIQVVGFPLGLSPVKSKLLEVVDAADEIDMVMNISAFMSGNYNVVEEEIRLMKEVYPNKPLKVIIGLPYLPFDRLIDVIYVISNSKADWIKTSTGWEKPFRPVSSDDIRLIASRKRADLRIKASGGIRDLHAVVSLWTSGADRIGTSAAVAIMEQFEVASTCGDKKGD
jgi:deoxyribose-phosphate aldolase